MLISVTHSNTLPVGERLHNASNSNMKFEMIWHNLASCFGVCWSLLSLPVLSQTNKSPFYKQKELFFFVDDDRASLLITHTQTCVCFKTKQVVNEKACAIKDVYSPIFRILYLKSDWFERGTRGCGGRLPALSPLHGSHTQTCFFSSHLSPSLLSPYPHLSVSQHTSLSAPGASSTWALMKYLSGPACVCVCRHAMSICSCLRNII